MGIKDRLVTAGSVLFAFWAVAIALSAILAAVAILIRGSAWFLKYTPLSSVPGINYIVGALFLALLALGINRVGLPEGWKNTGSESHQQRSDSGTPRGGGGGGDAGYLQYQCEQCGTVLDDWNINATGSSYRCNVCGHRLADQKAAGDKYFEGWAWDEEAEEDDNVW